MYKTGEKQKVVRYNNPMIKLVYLVRHGQYHNPRGIYPGRLPVPLSKEGRAEVSRLCTYFKDKNIEKIYSSSVLRCKQTSTIISDDSIPIQYDIRLLETFSAYQGYWSLGKTGHVPGSWDEFYTHMNQLGGEDYKEVQARMVSFFNDLLTWTDKNVIICSHGDPLQSLYYHLSGQQLPTVEEEKGELGNPLYQKKASVRLLTIEDGQYTFDTLVTQEDLMG